MNRSPHCDAAFTRGIIPCELLALIGVGAPASGHLTPQPVILWVPIAAEPELGSADRTGAVFHAERCSAREEKFAVRSASRQCRVSAIKSPASSVSKCKCRATAGEIAALEAFLIATDIFKHPERAENRNFF
jgi:hypothetical protein